MKSSSQKQRRETNLTYTNSGREGLASQKMGGNLLRFLSILMAAVFLTLTGSLTVLAADPVAVNDSYLVDEDQTLTDNVLTNDFDLDIGDFLSVSEVNGAFVNVDNPTPTANGTVTINVDGSFTYTPSGSFYGTDSFTYKITDGSTYSTEATVTITVNSVNDLPTISDITNQSTNEDTATAAIPFTVGDVETAVDSLTVTAISSDQAVVPDANIAMGGAGAARTITLSPAANQFGTTSITVTVQDANGGTASDTFVLTVAGVNDLPTLNDPADVAINEDAPLQTVNLSGIGMGAANEGQTLVVTASSGNAAIIPDPIVTYTSPNATGTLTFTPVANANDVANGGPTTITVTLSDGVDTVQQTFTVAVAGVNDLPTLNDPADVAINEDAPLQTVNLSGIGMGAANEGQTLVVTASSGNAAIIPDPIVTYTSPNATGTLTFTPVANANDVANGGPTTITVTLSDGVDTVQQTFTVAVAGVNDLPTLNDPADVAINEDAPLQTVNLSGIGMGAANEGQTLVVTASSGNAAIIPDPIVTYTSPNATGTLTFTPVANANDVANGGPTTITVTLSDGVDTVQQTFTVAVAGVNDLPTLNDPADVAINEDAPLQTVNLSGIGMGAANEGQTLVVTASSGNAAIIPDPIVTYTSPNATGTLTFTPVANANDVANGGPTTITVTLSDGVDTVQQTFTVAVAGVNDLPTLNDPADVAINEDAPLQTVNLSGIGMGAANEGQTLVVTASSGNAAIIPDPIVTYTSPNATGTLTFTPVANANDVANGGPTTITVTLSDGVDTVQQTFTVAVAGVNDLPTLNDPADVAINEDAPLQTVNLSGIGMGAANEGQTLVVTASSGNAAIIPDPIVTYTSPNATGTLTFTPVANANDVANGGPTTITVTLSDGVDTVQQTFTVAVAGVNDLPTLNDPADVAINEDAPLQTVNLSGIGMGAANEGQTLVVTASSGNAAIIPDPIVTYTSPNATGTLTFTPVANAIGSALITVTVSDGPDSVQQTFTVTVAGVNDLPTLNDPADVAINEDAPLQTVNLSGIGMGAANEGQTLVVTASSGNAAIIPDPIVTYTSPNATGTLTFTPVANANDVANGGPTTITVTLSDGVDTVQQTFTVAVAGVNDLPTLNDPADVAINEDAPLQTVNLSGIGMGAANEGQTLVVTASSGNAAIIPDPIVTYTSPNATGTLTFTPVANANDVANGGPTTITVTLSDGVDTVQQTFTVAVAGVNDLPTLNDPADVAINEDAPLQTVNLSGIGMGAANEGQTLVVTASSGNAAIIPDPIVTYTSPNATGTLTFTPVANANDVANGGPTTITVTLSDGVDTVQQTFTVAVAGVNDLPTLNDPADVAINEDAPLQTVNLSGIGMGAANEGQTLVVTASSGNAAIIPDPIVTYTSPNATGTLTFTPVANAIGSALITVTVSDGPDSVQQTFTVTVAGVNDVPVAQFSATPTSGTGPLSVTFTDSSTDIDNAIVGWTWDFGDGGTSAVQSPNHTYNFAGTFTARLTVSDEDGATHSTTTTITVIAGISIGDIIVNENAGTALFPVSLTVPPYSGNSVTVNYGTADGTAQAGADYAATTGTLTFNAGEPFKPLAVAVLNDAIAEFAEDFFVNLSSPSANAVINDNQGRCEISVTDVAQVSITDVTVDESAGTAVFTVTLNAPADFVITMDYATADNTATAGSDYTATSGNMAIAAGDTSGIISVPIINLVDREPTENFFVNLSSLSPGGGPVAFSKSQGTGTINDNDYRLTVTKIGAAADGLCNITASVGSVSGAVGGSGLNFFADYESGDEVTLTGTDTYPSAGSVFKDWGGSIGGSAYTTTVIMDSDKTVTANFNATYTLSITKAGSGSGHAEVTSGAGSDASKFPGGTALGTYLYEAGNTISLTGTDYMPSASVPGSEFENWTVDFGPPGGTFAPDSKNTSVIISGDLSITGNFRGKYMITSLARTGGSITPLGATIKYHGESQSYTMAASVGYVRSDTIIDGFSQGAQPSYTFGSITNNHTIIAIFQSGSEVFVGQAAGDEQIYTASVPPMVLMVMGKDHKLFYEAYNDASDLNGDGALDVGYNPAIDYYGYYDSYKVYKYDGTNNRFYPVWVTTTKKVDPLAADEWSGDFLNYLTMSRIDALRKVLYGGYRHVDTAAETVLMRSYIPQDAHAWGKEYESITRDGYDIREFTPLNLPYPATRHLFANVTLEDGTTDLPDLDRPLLRVLNDSYYRIWEWVSIERPVAGTRCLDGGSGPNCARTAVVAGHPGHPGTPQAFQALVDTYAVPAKLIGSGTAGIDAGAPTRIDGSGNPWGADDNYLSIFTGHINVTTAGSYRFAVDGDDAVEVLIDGVVRYGWYGSHTACNCTTYRSASFNLSSGQHTVEFRHETSTGTDSYHLYWRGPDSGNNYQIIPAAKYVGLTMTTYELLTDPTPASAIADYEVKVLVGTASLPETNCKRYPNGTYKPTGILQTFGEPGKLNFGLMTGSYAKNTSGGVLRKAVSSFTDEIVANTGQFKHKTDPNFKGIVYTIDQFRILNFTYSDYTHQNCGWITTRPINEGECVNWGNPIAEMMFEAMRYYAGQGSATPAFTYGTTATLGDNVLALPKATWDDPFVTNGACAKPFVLAITDINPSYDSNQLPGVASAFSTGFAGTLSSSDATPVAFDAEDLGEAISTAEGVTGNHYIGQMNTTYDNSCSSKDMTGNGFGRSRGLCPEEPTKQGSFYSASSAYFGRTHDINAATGTQNVLSYIVGLASPLPRIEIPVGTSVVTMVPFAKSVGGCLSVTPTPGNFQPTNTIVDFYVESLRPASGTFRINYEDVEQGADHDMDAIVIYFYQVTDDDGNPVTNPADGTRVKINLQSEFAAGCIVQHIGYIISGTTADGTYLEVRDEDTNNYMDCFGDGDCDYYLDTPPGVAPPATVAQWDDNLPLPLMSERIFTPGTTTAATLLESPLWYAAKWGGFVDQNDNNIPDLQSEWDADGDGVPDTYFYVVNPLKLEQQLTRTFSDILSRGVSHVAPVVSVDEANRTQSGDKLYMAFFKPMPDNHWQGNLKKYGLDFRVRDDCGRTDPEWTVVDQWTTDSGDAATSGYCDGAFKPGSRSFWSSEADGGYVDKGGVGALLKARMSGSDPKTPAAPYYSFRNIYTYKGALDGSMVPFLHANITNTDLEVIDNLTRYRIINFMYGYTYDAVSSANPNPVSKREWVLGDIIHSEPRIIDYFDDSGTLTHRFVAVGVNDGMLHVFTDSAVTIGGVTYQAGDEIFAFIPRDLLRRLQEFSVPNVHRYMVDGSPGLYRSNTKTDGTNFDKTLIFGERSGGRSYWALDVSKPNPADWKVKWQIEGGASGVTEFQELGYTWSKPFFTQLKTSATTTKEVVIFAGGYDTIEDGFPEGFDDQSVPKNGKWDTGELHGVTLGGQEGYDKWNPGMDTMGRGIYVVDIADGSILFKAAYGDDDGDGIEAEDVTTGINQKFAMMKYCFPADISVIPLSDSLIIMYAADVYGQIWRIRFDYFADLAHAYTSSSSTKWTVKRIFTANPGSTLASGDATAFTSGTQTLDTRPSPDGDAGRKMFYSPDVSLFGNDWTSSPILYVGTGDRQHARYTMISNRMYYVSDTGTVADETDLLNLTCDELDDEATVDADTKTALRNILEGGTNGVRGFYRVLDKQGLCTDGAGLSHVGEAVLSQPTLFFKNLYFTSYQPVFDDPCNPVGNAFIYALEYSLGTSAFNFDVTNDTTETDIRTVKDTYRFISGSSIPSGVRVIMRDGHAAGLISVGGAVAGVGEDGSTNIPGPPGGITPLLWETD